MEDELKKGDQNKFVKKIIELLNKKSEFNFQAYKKPTIFRRIDKRTKTLKINTFQNYYKFILKNESELALLAKDIFINVSYFFRDKIVFSFLEKSLIPKLILREKRTIKRIWVAGCATGEEAYTIAILIQKFIDDKALKGYKYKVIASDIDNDALNLARKATYSHQDVAKINSKILNHYFNNNDELYEVLNRIRENIIFTKHDLLNDPPFGKMDLILCRNVLIYINGEGQKIILDKFHFALNLNGFLVLGKSESPVFLKNNFEIVNKNLKIFSKNSMKEKFIHHTYNYTQAAIENESTSYNKMTSIENVELKDYVDARYQPAIVIVDDLLQVKYITKRVIKYVLYPENLAGEANFNQIFGDELIAITKSAIISLSEKESKSVFNNYLMGDKNLIDIHFEIVTFKGHSSPCYLIEFKTTAPKRKTEKLQASKINILLKNQLEKTELALQSTIKQLEKTNQNLESHNEELQSTNEEYLSVNEELQSINLEYQNSIDELSQANIYIDSLMQSTQIGSLFLDRSLRIMKFTHPISSLINITDSDMGRPIHHFTHQFLNDDWQNYIKKFLRQGKPIDEEIEDKENNWYLIKIRSYKLQKEGKKGASVSFVNINKLKEAESDLRQSELLFKSIFNAAQEGIILFNIKELRPVRVNKHLLKLYNTNEATFFKTPMLNFFPEISLYRKTTIEKREILADIITNSNVKQWIQKRKDGSRFIAEITSHNMPLPFESYTIIMVRDISEKVKQDKILYENKFLFKTIFDYANDGLVIYNNKTDKIENTNKKNLDLMGYEPEEYLKLSSVDRLPEYQLDDQRSAERKKTIEKQNKHKKSYKENWLLKRKDQTTFMAEINTVNLPKPFQNLSLNVIRDISEKVEFEERLKASELKYRAYFENSMIGIIQIDLNGKFLNSNRAFRKLVGYTKKELEYKFLRNLTHPDDIEISKTKLNLLQDNKVQNYIIEKRYVKKNKEVVFARVYVAGMYDKQKNLVQYYATVVDRTQEERAKTLFESSLKKYESLFKNSLVGQLLLSKTFKVIKFNKTVCKFLGVAFKESTNLELKKILHPESLKGFNKKLRDIKLKKVESFSGKFKFAHSKKYTIYANVYVGGIYNDNKLETVDITITDITNEVITTNHLTASKTRYKNYFNNSMVSSVHVDLAGHFLEVNNTFCKTFGYSRNDLTGLRLRDITHFREGLIDKDKIELIQQQPNKSIQLEKGLLAKNKKIIYTQIFISGMSNSENQLNGFHIMLIDKTEEVKAKNKLEINAVKYNALFKNSLVGECLVSKELKFLKANKKICSFLGYSIKELKATKILDKIIPDVDNEFKIGIKSIEADETQNFSIQQQFITKKGKIVFGRVYVTALKNAYNEVESYYVLLIDNTNEVEVTNNLVEIESRYKALFNNNTVGVVILKAAGSAAKQVNQAFVNILGYSEKELQTFDLLDITHPDDKKLIIKKINEINNNKINNFSITKRYIHKNGNIVFAKIFASGIYDGNKVLSGLYVALIDVSKEIENAAKLIESENRFKGIFENATYGISLFDIEKMISITCNKQMLRLLGCKTENEFTVTNVVNYLDPKEYSRKMIDSLYKTAIGKNRFENKFKIKKKNSTKYITVKFGAYLLAKPLNNIAAITLQNIDKEERSKLALDKKNKELLEIGEKLKLSKVKYEQLFKNNLVGIAIIDVKFNLQEVNDAFLKLSGYSKRDLLNSNIQHLIPKNSKKDFKEILRKVKSAESKTLTIQNECLRKDETIVYTNTYIKGFYKNKTEFTGALISFSDITEIVIISNKIKENENKLSIVVDNSFTFISQLDLNGFVISENKSTESRNKKFKKIKRVIGKAIWESSWLDNLEESKAQVKNDFLSVVKTGEPLKNQCRAKVSDEITGYLNYSIKLIKDDDKTPKWVLFEALDVTDLHQSRAKLTETVDELKQYIESNLELEKFAYITSHDLKEPLRTIISFSQLLQRKTKIYDNNDIAEYINFIISAAKNMNILIEDILSLSKVHNQSFKAKRIDLKKFIEETLADLKFTINKLKAKIIVKHLPEVVVANKTQLKQVFQNLISNGLKFVKPGIDPVITIDSIEHEEAIEFIITDNGIGIEEAYYKRVFLLFRRLQNKNKYEGSGIGLGICKKIVENHGGRIWVTSKIGKGSKFHFTIKKENSG